MSATQDEPLLDALEVGVVCRALCRLLSFAEVRDLSSISRRSAAISHTRVNFFARAKLSVPPLLSDAKLRSFLAGIRTDALPFITALRLQTDMQMVHSRAYSGVEVGGGIELLPGAGSNRGADSKGGGGGGNMLVFSPPPSRAAWSLFPNLETLDLSDLFSADLDPSIWEQPRVSSVDLSSNIDCDLALVARLPSLRHVFVNNTFLCTEDLVHLAPVTALETLEMTMCRFVNSLSALIGLTNLRRLCLGNGEMALRDFADFDAFTQLCHFEHVGLGARGPLVDLPLRAPELTYCDVSQTRLRDAEFLRYSPKLEHLNISGTGLRAGVPFGSLESLRVLVVSSPEPADAAFLAPLASLLDLTRVVVATDRQRRGGSVSEDAVRAVFPASVRPLLVMT